MTGGAQSDPSGPPPEPNPPGDRVWQHPSEVGLATRGRTDRRRSTVLAAGVVLGGIGLLVSGVLMGTGHRGNATTSTTTPMDRVARSVAHVTTVDAAGTTMLTGLVLDDQGHVLVPADAVAGAREVWARCDTGNSERAQVIGTDPTTNLAVLRLTEPSGWPATTVAAEPRRGAEVVTVHAKGGMDLAMRSGTVASDAGPGDTTTSGDSPVMQAQVRDAPDEGVANTGATLAGGLMFDLAGNFIGMTTADASGPGDDGMSMVDVMPASAALAVATRLIANG